MLKWPAARRSKIRQHRRCTTAMERMQQRMSFAIPTHLPAAAIFRMAAKNRIIACIQRQPFAILIQMMAIILHIQTQISAARTKSHQE